jgi:hypothetical protein
MPTVAPRAIRYTISSRLIAQGIAILKMKYPIKLLR